MPPTAKENEIAGTPEGGVQAGTVVPRPDETANRPQPVALEVPVTVNGARTVDGSDKREPFSETTKTVLVFGNGAVIRLSSPVAPGQLLFLTNEKTKKEVICQVVKSKNYRNVSGYVELEFTEPVVGFWGMRFPGDRIGAPSLASTPSPAVPPRASGNLASMPPAGPKIVGSSVNATPRAPETKLAPVSPTQRSAEAKPAALPASAPQAKTILPSAQSPASSSKVDLSTTARISELKPAESAVPPVAKQEPASRTEDSAMEALKLQAARLQEQLSSMLFSGATAQEQAPQAPPTSIPDKKAVSETANKVLELAHSEVAPANLAPPARVLPPPVKSSLDTEEVKIPAWLEPLARNAAAPSSTQEHIEREKARHTAELAEPEKRERETALSAPAVEAESQPEIHLPVFGELSLQEAPTAAEASAPTSSKRRVWIGLVAAATLLAATGLYFYKPSNPMQRPASNPSPQPAAALQPAQPVPQTVAATPANSPSHVNPSAPLVDDKQPVSSAHNAPVSNPLPSNNATTNEKSNQTGGTNARETTRETTKEAVNTVPASATERVSQPETPQSKKPALGDVHLETPKVNRISKGQETSVAAPSISTTEGDVSENVPDSGLTATNAKQPPAPEPPVPVGGDVKSAKLISSVSPIYPPLARSQHVSGDVKIDALIDATGRVTTMKILSGPTLLHQAARDALRQWKYQPATLDGNPVPMHLTVTLQFRLQ